MRTLVISTCAFFSAVLLAGGAAAEPELATPSIDAAPEAVTNSQTAQFAFSSTDNGVAFACSLDGEAFTECESPADYALLSEGTHGFAVRTSRGSNAQSNPAAYEWTVDLTAPAVSLVSPGDGTTTSDDTPSFEGIGGIAEGDESEVTLEVFESSQTSSEPLAALTAAIDPESGAWSATLLDPLPAGSYTAQAEQADAAGNVGTSLSTFVVDPSVPAVTLAAPANGSLTTETRPVFSGTADSGVVTVDVYEEPSDGADPVLTLTASVDEETGTWSTQPEDGLPDGLYSAVAEQTSPAGTGSSNTVTFTIDATAPVVTVVSPAGGSATNDDTPSFAGEGGISAGDEAEVAIAVWAGSDTSAEPLAALTAPVDPDSGAWSAALDEAMADGVYSVEVEQADAAGNTAVSGFSFAVDTAPPAFVGVGASQIVEQTSPAGAVATYGAPATDELDPAPKVACSPPSGAVFPAGVTTVSCRATDWAGNSAESRFTVTVVNTIRPAAVQGFRARGANGRVGLRWERPTDWDYHRISVRRTRKGTSTWRVVYEGRLPTAITDRSVTNDTEYVYEVVSYDTAGNVSATASTGARPSAFLAPSWNALWHGPNLLRWAPVRNAAYYNVQVWRNGRKILSRWPTRSRFGLPRTWRQSGRRYSLDDGIYVVYAWPGFGPKNAARYGRLVGWTKFRID